MTTSTPPTLHTLANGLTVLLEENHNAPVISLNVLAKIGSAMETDAEAGICHFIEHMLFKGTPHRPVGQIARDVEAAGGEINAYTSFDHTVYYINMASRFAAQGLEILADAVQHPLFDQGEVTREAEVICEEIRRGHDNPQHVLSEHLFHQIYGTHPYGRPIIGFAETVKSFSGADLRAFWQRWYTAKNLTLVVVGDFETVPMLRRIESLFGDLSTDAPPTPAAVAIPVPVTGPRCFQERLNIESSYFAIGFPIPPIVDAAVPAIDLLSHVLGGGESSRLELEVKERQQLVHSIYTYPFTARGTGLFVIGGMAHTDKMKAVIPAIWKQVEQLLAPGNITTAEIDRAKLNIQCAELYERETVGGQAAKHAYFLSTANTHQFERQYYQAIAATTRTKVRDTLAEYLTPTRGVLTWIAPKRDRLPPAAQTARLCRLGATDTRPTTVPGPRPSLRPVVQRLPNGMRCVVRTDHRLPLVAMQAIVLGGTRYETPATNGISTLLASLITKGTRTHDAAAVAETIDAIGGGLHAGAGRNSFMVRMECLAAKLTEGFGLFAEVLREPAFAADELAKEKGLLCHAIRNQEDNLAAMAHKHFCKALYGTHPYALSSLGEIGSVRRITRTQIERFYDRMIQPHRMVLSVSGDITADAVAALVHRYLNGRTARRQKEPRIPTMPAVKPRRVVVHRDEKQQAHLFYGFRGTTVGAGDRYIFSVLQEILSGQGGRLFLELRDRQSLAYSVSASLQLGLDPGFFAVYIGTEPGKVDTAIHGIERELARLIDEPISAEELTRAQQHLVGTYELDLQRNSSIAGIHALNVLYGLGLDEAERYPERILKVTADDVHRLAKKYFRRDTAVCAIVTP